MKTTRLTAIAITAAVLCAPTAAQSAGDEPTKSASKLSGLPPLSQVHNQKARKKLRSARAGVRARSAWIYNGGSEMPGQASSRRPRS